MTEKSLNERAKEALVGCMENNYMLPSSVAEIGKAYAAILTAEAAVNQLSEAVNAIKEL